MDRDRAHEHLDLERARRRAVGAAVAVVAKAQTAEAAGEELDAVHRVVDERDVDAELGVHEHAHRPADAFSDELAAQTKALDAIAAFDPGLLILSYGADTYAGDPISAFRIETEDYRVLAADIAARGWPTVIVMEGGYAVDALGRNVASLLSGFD